MPKGTSGLKAPVISNYIVNGNSSVTLSGSAQGNSEVTVYDGQTVLGTTTTNSAGAWTYTTTALAAGTQVFTATVTNAGNTSAASNAVDPVVAGEAGPAVVSVASSGTGIANGKGDLTVGSVVTLTLNMSEAVTVAGGTPTLTLDDGGTASYVGGSGSDALTFSYMVAAGQNTSNLTVAAVNPNGATITGAAGNAIFSGILTAAGTLQIDTTPPTVTSVATSGTGITNGNGDIGTGSTVTLMLGMSEAVTVAGGTPTLTLDDGGTATYTGGSGSDELSFSYTVADGQNTSDLTATAINLNGAGIADAAGNNADLAGTLTPTGTLQVDTTSTIVLTPDNYEYDPAGPWSANASAWNAGSLVYGVDYSQSITISDQGIPNGTLMSWVWPWTSGPGGVYSYPEIVYGSTPFLDNASVQSTQVANFADLSTSYSISLSGYTSGFDTIFDMWLTSQPNGNYTTREYELEIVAHSDWTPPASNIAYSLTDSTLQNANVYVTPNYTDDGVSWTNITVAPGSDILAGTISISDILKNLIWNGVITGQEYLSGVEFGPEVSWGTGSLLVNNLNYQWDGTPTIELATGNNTFDIVTPGGNDIQGNGGVDTVVYSGLYSQFQIKTSGSEALVMENNNISTLDVLNGVTYVEFSDGKYDVATSTFAAATSISQAAGSEVVSVANSGTGIANGSGDLTIGGVVTLTLAMSEAVTVAGGTPTLTLNDGATATYSGGSGTNALTFSYTVAAGQNTPDLTATAVNLNSATIIDGAGNAANLSLTGLTQTGPQIDTSAPTVSSLVASPSTGDLDAGKTVTLTLAMSEAVTVAGGTPTLTLNDGATATYSGGSGTNALTFSYTVAAGQNTPDLTATAVNLNSATIIDGAGNAANLSLTGLTQTGPQIDTSAPMVSSLVASPSTGDLDAGKTVTLTLAMSEAVTVAGGTPTLTLNDGATATYSGGSGTNALTFSYTVAAGQNTPDLTATAVNLNSATIIDGAGNAANLSLTGLTQTGPQIDTSAPTVSSLVASPSTGDLDAGKTVTLTLAMSEAVTVAGGTPTLTLNDGATATYSGGSGTNALTFSYTVAAGQNTPDLTATAVNLNSATIIDGAGNAANLSLTGLTQTGPQIDTSAPVAPVIANDVVNANNSVTLTGTAEANSSVTVYDGQTAVGSTVANASGAWSYSTGPLANGSQVFTATATDAAGNIGAASTAVDPIIGALTGTLSGTLSGTNSVADGTTLSITGMVNNTGTIALNAAGSGADLAIVGAATLTGAGKVTLSNNIGNVIGSNGTTATLTNANNTISGAGTIGDSQLTLNNQSTINANGSSALVIGTGANTVTNSGTLEATSTGGLDIDANVNNSKTIEALGTNTKVVIQGAITNTSSGLIFASGSGAQVDLSNATVSGGTLQTSGSNAFIETVAGANAFNGGAINSGSTVEINSGTTLAIGGTVKNSGTVLVNGTLDVVGALNGGVTDISGAGKMVIAAASSESVVFIRNSTGQLVLDQAPIYTGQISGFGTTQSIDLADINFSAGVTMSYAPKNRQNTSGVLTIKQGNNTVSLELQGSYTLANFRLASDSNGGTLVTDPTVVTQQLGNKAATIGNNTVLEVNTRDNGNVTFTGTSGTLWLDQPSIFTGKVSGLAAQNGIDLSKMAFGAHATLGYSPNNNNTGGTLSIINGSQSASIGLLGSYMASSFVMESDNHGGTMILADAAQSASQSLLTNPQHS